MTRARIRRSIANQVKTLVKLALRSCFINCALLALYTSVVGIKVDLISPEQGRAKVALRAILVSALEQS